MSVASKAKKAKGPTFKNYLATPLPTKPATSLTPEHVAAVKASLELLRPLMHREAVDPATKTPHPKRAKKAEAAESVDEKKKKQQQLQLNTAQTRATPDPAHIVRRGIMCTGVNEVTRALEKSQARLVVYSSDIQVKNVFIILGGVLDKPYITTALSHCRPHCPSCRHTRCACVPGACH